MVKTREQTKKGSAKSAKRSCNYIIRELNRNYIHNYYPKNFLESKKYLTNFFSKL